MVKGKKHILIICPFAHPNLGGVETHIDKLIKRATQKNFYVTLLTYQPLTRPVLASTFEKHKNYEIHRVFWFGNGVFPKIEPYFPLVFLYLFPGLCFKSILFYLKNRDNVDCIHSHGLVAALIAKVLVFIKPVRTVVSTHAVYRFGERKMLSRLVKAILSGFDAILAVSEVSRREIINMGFREDQVKVHPNWVDTTVFRPLQRERALLDLKISAKCNVLFVGRLLEIKGVGLILDAAEKCPKIAFHVVGSGPMEHEVDESAKKMKNVRFYGTLMQHDQKEFNKLLQLYSLADFFVSPYLYDEGFSAALIEAVATGTPVIVSNRGSPPTFLSNEVAYFLSKNPNAKEVARALNNLCGKIVSGNPPFSSQKCRSFAEKHFGPKNADVIIESYEQE